MYGKLKFCLQFNIRKVNVIVFNVIYLPSSDTQQGTLDMKNLEKRSYVEQFYCFFGCGYLFDIRIIYQDFSYHASWMMYKQIRVECYIIIFIFNLLTRSIKAPTIP